MAWKMENTLPVFFFLIWEGLATVKMWITANRRIIWESGFLRVNISAMKTRWRRSSRGKADFSSPLGTVKQKKTCHDTFIIIVDVFFFFKQAWKMSCRPCWTWWKFDLSRNCFSPYEMPAVSLVSWVHPRRGGAHCGFIWRRPPGLDPRNSGWAAPPTSPQNNTQAWWKIQVLPEARQWEVPQYGWFVV